ncbi:uncharacterized protein LOC122375805, partial [Amphibalanus amphitrite]|uniref:uncharacterized protein LOC122375805 n=1 Tax=Amphibalanus amphitrite TaxID=1232801 RepID=UPI001C8FF589
VVSAVARHQTAPEHAVDEPVAVRQLGVLGSLQFVEQARAAAQGMVSRLWMVSTALDSAVPAGSLSGAAGRWASRSSAVHLSRPAGHTEPDCEPGGGGGRQTAGPSSQLGRRTTAAARIPSPTPPRPTSTTSSQLCQQVQRQQLTAAGATAAAAAAAAAAGHGAGGEPAHRSDRSISCRLVYIHTYGHCGRGRRVSPRPYIPVSRGHPGQRRRPSRTVFGAVRTLASAAAATDDRAGGARSISRVRAATSHRDRAETRDGVAALDGVGGARLGRARWLTVRRRGPLSQPELSGSPQQASRTRLSVSHQTSGQKRPTPAVPWRVNRAVAGRPSLPRRQCRLPEFVCHEIREPTTRAP